MIRANRRRYGWLVAGGIATACLLPEMDTQLRPRSQPSGMGEAGSSGSTPPCTQGRELCAGVCRNLDTDPMNCGTCGQVCAVGMTCDNGACVCWGGLAACNGQCVDLAGDVGNCGSCGTRCVVGQRCASGSCECLDGLEDCGGTCEDLMESGAHCGACDSPCPMGQVCSQGVCSDTCEEGLTKCGSDCVDLTSSIQHCGVCDNACPSGQSCANSECTCDDGQTACGGQCVVLATDAHNCGACGNVCATGQHCDNGMCTCTPPQQLCGEQCTDVREDPQNCGVCGTVCEPGSGCISSECVPLGAGGAGAGGAQAGGLAEAGADTGGLAEAGADTGGLAEAGADTGGAATGGAATGGLSTGGAEIGGSATGGVATGGSPTGGGSTGGVAATGGSATGGSSTGGVATGGSATGGSSTGGVATGGQATGGGAGTGGDDAKSSGCGATSWPTSSADNIINVGGTDRSYILRIPDDYDTNHPYRLILAYHWLNGTAADVADDSSGMIGGSYYGLWDLANGSTIFVAPQGINNGWSNSGGQDVEFTRALVTELESQLCIDTSRIFAEGFSMGGSMAYAVACAMGDIVRAVAVLSGGSMSGCDQSNRLPVAYFMTHGTNDTVCTYPSYGVPQLNDFAERNGCTAQTLPTPSGTTPSCIDFPDCMPEYPTRACIFVGSHTPSPPSTSDTWVPQEAWDFISQF